MGLGKRDLWRKEVSSGLGRRYLKRRDELVLNKENVWPGEGPLRADHSGAELLHE